MAENPQAQTTLLFYKQISPLHPGKHSELKIGQVPNQGFAAQTNSVPVAGIEFAEAAKEYPIVFTKSGEDFSPVVVLGLENGENLYLDNHANWKAHYVPAFVRRYPFVLGENVENPEQPWVCVDEACPWLSNEKGEPLFVEGKPSTFMTQMLNFLTDYNLQSVRTTAFIRKLKDWGLFKENQATARTADGKNYTLTGLWVIDEAAFNKLGNDQLQELFKTGELAWIYFHLVSLSNFRILADRKSGVGVDAGPIH